MATVGVSRYPEPTTAKYPLASRPSSENSKNLSTGETEPEEAGCIILFYVPVDCYHGRVVGGGLDSAIVSPEMNIAGADRRRRAVLIVVACTFMGAAAQVLIKVGANRLGHAGFVETVLAIFTILPLFAGYFLYGIFAALLVYALRDGELSIVYPVIALTYVWVTILSVVVFHETINPMKAIGVTIIVAGVAVLGRGSGH